MNVLEAVNFFVPVFVICDTGDISTTSLILCMKGHNALYPCQMCAILGGKVLYSIEHRGGSNEEDPFWEEDLILGKV